MERRESPETQLLVATEGILTAQLQTDPLASAYSTIILDEFHERSIHSDLAISMAREAWRARDDLQLVVMSATLDAAGVAAYLGSAPVVTVPGRAWPVATEYEPQLEAHEVIRREIRRSTGHVLVFLPGAGEIDRLHRTLTADPLPAVDVWRLHARLPLDEQDRAIAPSSRRKLVLATNVAETSITIEGVGLVIDSGLHRVMRYEPSRGIDHLVLERIPADSAAQRAGRAGRTGPGRAVRLWEDHQILRPHREPEIARVDLAAPLLQILSWGGDPGTFPWFEKPDQIRMAEAMRLITTLGFLDEEGLTDAGRIAARLPLHPRVAAFVLAAGSGSRARGLAALLAEGDLRVPAGKVLAGDSDLFLLEGENRRNAHVSAVSVELRERLRREGISAGSETDEALLRALLAGWPDRVARRREGETDRYVLASGAGALLARESSVRNAEWLLAIEVSQITLAGAKQGLIRVASAIDPAWLVGVEDVIVHSETADSLDARRERRYGSILIDSVQIRPADERVEQWRRRRVLEGGDPLIRQLARRIRFAGLDVDLPALAVQAPALSAPSLEGMIPWKERQSLERLAPLRLRVPSGRELKLEYREDGGVELEVKLQELFGMTETPRIGPAGTPVTMVLLSPGGRPVQTTQDLRSFWASTYFDVRRELRGRYPKHPWPEDPLTATPTARTRRRS